MAIAAQHQLHYPHLQIVPIQEVPEGWSPKKWALQKGITHATHQQLLFTDADCEVTPRWIEGMISYGQPHTEIILGIGRYHEAMGLLNRFVQFETFFTAFQYVGFAELGMPYMAVGRNLAYTKSFFNRNQGFEQFKHYVSGDDDLLINAFAKAEHISSAIEPYTTTLSVPPSTWETWWQQKTRHVSASPGYRWQTKWWLSLFHLSHVWFYLGIIVTWHANSEPTLIGLIFLLRMIISGLIARWLYRRLRYRSNWGWWAILDFLYFLYNLSVVPVGLIKKPSWRK